MDYASARSIDFTSSKRRRRGVDLPPSEPDTGSQAATDVKRPTNEEQAVFFREISQCGLKPAILSLVPLFSDLYVPKTSSQLPPVLTDLFKAPNATLPLSQLRDMATSVSVVITSQQATAVEKATRGQAKSKVWYAQRAGRITASKMHQVLKSGDSPASLVKNICYPEEMAFVSAATSWGQKQEAPALARYMVESSPLHTGLTVSESGLVINPAWPYIGASPDGLLSCQCCGLGVVEVKCPYSQKGRTLAEAMCSGQPFCLEVAADGSFQLSRSHPYYAQVQTQLHVCDVEYCDFCVCSFAGDRGGDLHIERIVKDPDF